MEVSRPLLTGAKWCHAVPLSDHLSAWLASTQVIKAPCPSCEIKDHITKGQFGSIFNHIYCSCISVSLFLSLLAPETIMRMATKERNKSFSYSYRRVEHVMAQFANLSLEWLQSLLYICVCVNPTVCIFRGKTKKITATYSTSVNLE